MKGFVRIAIVVVVVAAVAAGAYLRFFSQPSSAASTANLNTATVGRGTVAATVNAAGNITSQQSDVLNFQQSGIVQKVNVQVGDQVKAGEVLAQLDTTALNLALQNAKANLQAAQDKLTLAKNPNTPQDIANARAALDSAKANYAKLTAPPNPADLTAAQGAVASAQAAYNSAVATGGAGNSQINAAAQAVQNAQAALQQAQSAYDKVAGQPNVAALPQSLTLQQDTIAYQTAVDNYQALKTTSGPSANSTIQQAKSQLDTALANLAKTTKPNTPQDIQAAQDQVAQAQNNLDKLLAGPDAATVDEAQVGVTQAQVAVQQAQLALQQAQIVSPIDGVVTAVGITQGQGAATASNQGGGAVGDIQVVDMNHLQIVVPMAETDVVNVKVGQPAQITLEALPDVTIQGKVTEVSPAGTVSQGVVNFPVTISIVNPPPSVKTGMSVNVAVITQQVNDALMVPNRAVRTQGRQKFVTVLFEGQQIQVPVTTGLSNDTTTQITSGLQEGDVVVLNPTTTTTPGGRGPGGFVPGVGRIGG